MFFVDNSKFRVLVGHVSFFVQPAVKGLYFCAKWGGLLGIFVVRRFIVFRRVRYILERFSGTVYRRQGTVFYVPAVQFFGLLRCLTYTNVFGVEWGFLLTYRQYQCEEIRED